jgi:hypothetical protein
MEVQNWHYLHPFGWKHEIRSHKVCGQSFKKILKFLKNYHGNNVYQKICIIFEINFYTFKVATKNFSWKFTMFQESFYMFKGLKKSMWTSFFFVQNFFFIMKCSLNHFKKIVKFNIFHKKGSMCSKHSKNKNTCMLLDFDT